MEVLDFLSGGLLSMTRSIVQDVMNAVNAQINLITNGVVQPLKAEVQQVVGGVWKGYGASRFVEEMNLEVIPALANIGDSGVNFGSLIANATNILNQADSQATQMVNSLEDVFSTILGF